MELGSSLFRNSHGSRSDDIEQAIDHFNHALEVFTYLYYPMQWAEIHNNLAVVYSHRILGNKADNIEQVIKHCLKALMIHKLEKSPLQWATTEYILADAYRGRIYEDKALSIEIAIEHYKNALKLKTEENFPFDWAMIHNNIALAYSDRIKGNGVDNIEQVIKHYDEALRVFTYKNFPMLWVKIHINLASAFGDRTLGDKAKNIESVIKHYKYALRVYTQKDFPENWATTQNNLGNVYLRRIQGERAENVERSAKYYNSALKVYTYNDFPAEWAMTQNNLAIAYWNRIKGDRAENIEKAIENYNKALKVRTQSDLPKEWAETQNNLGVAYCERIRGDKAENIEQAIKHHIQALEVRAYVDFPIEWAKTQINLANAYWNRVKGKRAENIEKAIDNYNRTLNIFTIQNFPVEWATNQANLATAHWNHVKGNKSDNIEKAIEYYNRALYVFTIQNYSFQWAGINANLASCYCDRTKGDKDENIEKAIEYCNKALKVYTCLSFPVEWAMTQNNLATAYIDRAKGDRTKNIEKAIYHFHNALQIYKLGTMPKDFRNTCRLLGDLYFNIGQWKDAMESYKDAMNAGDLLYRSGLSTESKIDEIRKNSYIYRNASLAACRSELINEALIILERGKTRLLTETLRLKMKQPEIVPKNEWEKYEQAAEKYQSSIKLGSQEDYFQREKKVQKAQEHLDYVVSIVQKYNPDFQKELNISDILLIPDKETALLTFCITDKGSIGFVVSEGNVQSVEIPFKTKDLNNLLYQLDRQGYIIGGLIGKYLNYLNSFGTNHQIDAFLSWQKALNDVLFRIDFKLLSPLLAKIPSQIKKLVLMPSGGLFLLPLHAITLSNGQLLCQRYCISYVPSIQLLKEVESKAEKAEGKGLYAVINPEEDLKIIFSEYEGQAISKLFEMPQVNIGETGTKATVQNYVTGKAYLHFSCHGSYNWNDPPQSGLHLFGGRTLSLADLQNNIVDMSSSRLVTLSACETGITDILQGSADEFVGLPAGFMLAGVPCVVSSLWSVPDISTAILMERFYSNHIKKGMDIPLALQDAQLWVRDLTSSQAADYVEKCYISGKWEGKSKEFIERYRKKYIKMAKEFPDKRPFEHPYYWAAFTVNGA